MKTQSDLIDFYYKELHLPLTLLEKKRKKLLQKLMKVALVYTIFILGAIIYIFQLSYNTDIIIFGGFFYIAGATLLYKYLIKNYSIDFKDQIIAPLITAIDENLSYTPYAHVSKHSFINSKIFTSHPHKFTGNDFVQGKIDDVNIEFSDIHAQKIHKSTKGKHHYETLFKGLFIVADFHKYFKGNTVILPDMAQNSFGNIIGNWFQSNNFNRDELIKMDNVDFEKEFVVYGTNQIEARYILSHTLMEKLLAFKKKSKHSLSISFVGGNIYLAIHYNKDLFEPSIFHSLLKYKIAMEYVGTLHLAIGIVDELKLNQKLWRKL